MGKLTIYGQDIDEYLRCPYRLIKSKRDGVKPTDYISSEFVTEVLFKNGLKFEEDVLMGIEWQKTSESLDKLIKKQCIINHPLIEVDGNNISPDFKDIKFIGCPDFIIADNNIVFPVEIKNHRNIIKMDKYRLAFYSMLLSARYKSEVPHGLLHSNEGVKEAELHRKVFYEMLDYKKNITIATLIHWHKELFKETKKDKAGLIRNYDVGISGSKNKPPHAVELDMLLREFFDWYNLNKDKLHPVHLAALVHLKFVSIHPFGDGNGRISRLLMNHVLNKNNYPMLIIDYSQRNSYYNALEKSQMDKEVNFFTIWFFKRYVKEYESYLE